MLFTVENCDRILAGVKTQTRRAVKPTDQSSGIGGPTATVWGRTESDWLHVYNVRARWRVGKTYAVQPGRGQKSVGRIIITSIRYCTRAGDISEQDAIAEGFETPEQFSAVYAALNGNDSLDRPCWALTFVLVGRVNRLDEVFGKWPGDEDEAALLAQLRALDGKE